MRIELTTRISKEEGWVRGTLIGVGNSGTVSISMSRSNGQLFALKSTTSFSLALQNEYHILWSLDSPFIIHILGYAKRFKNREGVHNLFMEYMSDGSITDLQTKFGGRMDEYVIRAYRHGILHGIH
jgi:serine/threonine protein kinase